MNRSYKNRVVISLTTLPSRINSILPTLKSLNKQTYKVDDIYLTIPKKCKRLNTKYPSIPENIKKLCTIVYIKNDYGPITKLWGGLYMEQDPETIIITVDDDIIYPKTLVENLLNYNNKIPNTALSSSGLAVGSYPFCYSIKFNQKKNDYWFTLHSNKTGHKVDILYGYPGAMYIRKFFPKKQYMYKKLFKYAKYDYDLFKNDDVLISCYLNNKNIDRKIVDIPDVINCKGVDGLSMDAYNFFRSMENAINKCKKMGWFKSHATVNPIETFGFIGVLIFIALLIILLLFVRYRNRILYFI